MTFFGPDIRNGLPIGLGSTAGFGRRAFTPSVLFAAGEQGAWYDPTDIPVNWRRNLLTYTEQFDNAAWDKNGLNAFGSGSVANTGATTDPSGGNTADYIQENTANTVHYVGRTTTLAAQLFTFSVYAKAAERSALALVGESDGSKTAWFNLSTGVVHSTGASVTATITSVGNSWYRCTATFTGSGVLNTTYIAMGATLGTLVYTGTGASGLYIWGAQFEVGSAASDYQRIVTPEISFLDYQPQPVMYTDSAGTTPVTAVEQAVGLILDKSKGLVLGPELVTNGGPFVNTTGWTGQNSATLSVASGKLRVSGNGTTAFPFASTSFTTVIGRGYFINANIAFVSGVNDSVYVQKSDAAASVVNGVTSGTAPATSKTLFFVATATTTYLQIVSDDATDVYDWDNISVRELAGNHAIQPGSTNRPILRSRYNLLTYSEDFSNAAWTKTAASVSANAGVAPDGTTTADKLIDTAASTYHFTSQTSVTPTASTVFVGSIYLKAAERTFACVQIVMGGVNALVGINLSTGALTTPTAGSASVSSAGNGWYLVSLTVTTSSTTAGGLYAYTATSLTNDPTYLGDGTSGIYVWGADLRRSIDAISGIPSYQRIAAATDYDTVGFPVYLAFDGSDDSLYTSSIDFSATDRMTVFAGATKLSDAAAAVFAETSASYSLNNGAFALAAPDVNGASSYATLIKGAGANPTTQTYTTYTAPVTSVFVSNIDLAGATNAAAIVTRIDAASPTTSPGTSGAPGGGNFGNYPLYIGRRNNASLPFNGRLYSLVVRGAQTSAALIQQAERWVAGKQGRAL